MPGPRRAASGGSPRRRSPPRPHQNYYNADDYNSNELEELRRKHQHYRKQLEDLLEEHCRNLSVAVLVALTSVPCAAADPQSAATQAATAARAPRLCNVMLYYCML